MTPPRLPILIRRTTTSRSYRRPRRAPAPMFRRQRSQDRMPDPVRCGIARCRSRTSQKIKLRTGDVQARLPGRIRQIHPERCCRFDLDGRRYLILKKSFDLGMVQFEGRARSRQRAYTLGRCGERMPRRRVRGRIRGRPLFVGFNSVRLRDADAPPGIYVAIRGLPDGWPGCLLGGLH